MDRIINRLTNIVIILGVLWVGYVYTYPPTQKRAEPYAEGEKIAGLEGPALVLVTRSSCEFCTASLPFYRELQSKTKIKTIGVTAESLQDNAAYLAKAGVRVDQLAVLSDVLPRVANTPTLILISPDGKVVKSWTGQIPDAKQREVETIVIQTGEQR